MTTATVTRCTDAQTDHKALRGGRNMLVTTRERRFAGYMIRSARERAGMTEADLAAALTDVMADHVVLEEDVRAWEVSADCPSCNAGLAIAYVLGIPEIGSLTTELRCTYAPDWLRRAREAWGLSERAAARQAGVTLSTLRSVESGAGRWPQIVFALLGVYSVTLPELRARYGPPSDD